MVDNRTSFIKWMRAFAEVLLIYVVFLAVTQTQFVLTETSLRIGLLFAFMAVLATRWFIKRAKLVFIFLPTYFLFLPILNNAVIELTGQFVTPRTEVPFQYVAQIIGETSVNEIFEFFSSYGVTVLYYLVLYVFGIWLMYRVQWFFHQRYVTQLASSGISTFPHKKLKKWSFVVIVSVVLSSPLLINASVLPYLAHGTYHLLEEREAFLRFQTSNQEHVNEYFARHPVTILDDQPNTLVLVVGESLNRDDMGIYGYSRETTPNLRVLHDRGELYRHQNSYSTAASTVRSLRHALTLSKYGDDDWYKTPTLLQVVKEAGYKIYWLSNQQTYGNHDSPMTWIAAAADVKRFVNARGYFVPSYDEILLPHLNEALADPARKKLIVLHTLGSHFKYKNRYDERFKIYDEISDSVTAEMHKLQRSEDVIKLRSEYDNSVVYTDYFLSQVIGSLKKQSNNTQLLFFSDHGEDVGHDLNRHGHSESTLSGFKIPLLIWMDENYRQHNWASLQANMNKPFTLDMLPYTVFDLLHIQVANGKEKRSLFSESYQVNQEAMIAGKKILTIATNH